MFCRTPYQTQSQTINKRKKPFNQTPKCLKYCHTVCGLVITQISERRSYECLAVLLFAPTHNYLCSAPSGAEGTAALPAMLGAPTQNPNTTPVLGLLARTNSIRARLRMRLLGFTWWSGGPENGGSHLWRHNSQHRGLRLRCRPLLPQGQGVKGRDEFPWLRSIRHIFPVLY